MTMRRAWIRVRVTLGLLTVVMLALMHYGVLCVDAAPMQDTAEVITPGPATDAVVDEAAAAATDGTAAAVIDPAAAEAAVPADGAAAEVGDPLAVDTAPIAAGAAVGLGVVEATTEAPVATIPAVSVVPEVSVGAGWTPINVGTDLPTNFFFAMQGDKVVVGKTYFAFCTVRDGLEAPACLGNKDDALVENAALTETESFKLYYPGNNQVMIATSGNLFWQVDTEARVVKFTDRSSATRFQVFINDAKNTFFIKSGDFYVRTSEGKLGEPASLSPTLVGRSFFHSWQLINTVTKENIEATRLAIAAPVLAARRLATGPNQAWVAYDLALAVLLKKQLNTFFLQQATGSDLAVIVDQATDLMTTSPLREEYSAIYPSFGKWLPDDFDLYTWSAAVNTTGTMPWQEMINKVQGMARSQTDPLRDNFRTVALASFYVANRDLDQQLLKFSAPSVYEAYFVATCNLAWVARGNLTLNQVVENTQFPFFTNETLDKMHLQTGSEDFWFTKFIRDNATQTTVTPSNVFPEMVLLKHLDSQWVSVHSSIGEGIAKLFLKRINAHLQVYDIPQIIALLAEPVHQQILETLGSVCKPETKISICMLPGILQTAKRAESFVSMNTNPAAVVDLRSVTNQDLQTYVEELKKESVTAALVEKILTTKNETKLLSDQMFNDVAEKMENSMLETMLKTNQQMRDDAVAVYDQVKSAASFQMEMFQTSADLQVTLAQEKYAAAMAVKDQYLANMAALSEKALNKAMFGSFMAVTKSVVSFGSSIQTIVKQPQNALNSQLETQNQFVQMSGMLSQVSKANVLIQTLNELIPQVKKLSEEIAEKLPKIQELRDLAIPLAETKNFTNIDADANAYLQLYAEVKRFDLVSPMNVINSAFSSIAAQMCVIIARPAYKPCVDILKDSNEFFGNIRESVTASNAVLLALSDVVGSAFDAADADQSYGVLTANAERNSNDLASVTANWNDDQNERNSALFRMRKQQDTEAAVFTALSMQSQTTYLQWLFLFCARISYVRGGNMPDTCANKVMGFQRVTNDDINQLLSFVELPVSPPKTLIAYIPTSPQFPNDTGAIDLAQLMNGQPVTFQLPQNATWLKKFNWISQVSELQNSALYLTKMRLVLPPRFTDYQEEVTITIETQGVSDLGASMSLRTPPALRFFHLSPASFVVNYGTNICQGTAIKNPYSQCGASLPDICFQKEGESASTNKVQPSLFSEFRASAFYESPTGQTSGLAYRSIATPLLLRVEAETVSSSFSTRLARNLRAETTSELGEAQSHQEFASHDAASRTLAASSRCCKTGSYIPEWNRRMVQGTCVPCPPGSVSQLGGLMCLFAYGNANAQAATGGRGSTAQIAMA